MGGLTKPSAPVILVLEAVIVLLSPKHAFSGPNPAVFGASWAASHRLLFLPPAELAHRLRSVDAATVPPHNIDALLKYLSHPDWPLPGGAVGGSRHLGRIAEWVNAVVQYNQVGWGVRGPLWPLVLEMPLMFVRFTPACSCWQRRAVCLSP